MYLCSLKVIFISLEHNIVAGEKADSTALRGQLSTEGRNPIRDLTSHNWKSEYLLFLSSEFLTISKSCFHLSLVKSMTNGLALP